MKKCPYCAEEIQDAAIKCKHCSEFLDGSGPSRATAGKTRPWYLGAFAIVLSFITVGPLALPLVWVHPQLKPIWKIAITVLVVGLSWMACQMIVNFLSGPEVTEYMKMFNDLIKMSELR